MVPGRTAGGEAARGGGAVQAVSAGHCGVGGYQPGPRRRRAQRGGDRKRVFGAAASSTTIWRLVDAALCPAFGLPRARSGPQWAAGAAPGAGQWLHLDVDATQPPRQPVMRQTITIYPTTSRTQWKS
jgi:hypothetical protein